MSGQSGQGVDAERCAGGSGMISNWVTWRPYAGGCSQAVGARIAAADDDTFLPVALIHSWSGIVVARIALVVLRQELHGEVDTLQLAAWDFQVPRRFCPTGQHDRLKVLLQVFDRNIGAYVRVGDERDAFGFHLLDTRSMWCFSILKSGIP